MIIVDSELERREQNGNPIRVAMVGAGYMGRGIALQIEQYITGMSLVAIANRTPSAAIKAYQDAGANPIESVENIDQLETAIAAGHPAVTDDATATVWNVAGLSKVENTAVASMYNARDELDRKP